jgi:hypothetical protein
VLIGWVAWSCSLAVELPEAGAGGNALDASTGNGGDETAVRCVVASDCPGDEGECVTRTCRMGVCGVGFVDEGKVLASQQSGDCVQRVCDGEGSVEEEPLRDDVQIDLSECTEDKCEDGATVHIPLPEKTLCENDKRMCNGKGECVECVDPADCAETLGCDNDVCTCDPVAFECELKSCQNGTQDVNETDVDCGGPDCSPCDVGGACEVSSDCISFVCSGNDAGCLAPTCNDMVTNGDETDVDCGGTDCGPCDDGKACELDAHCISGVCDGTVCAAPSCSDGVVNGLETDVDCGGGKCNPCGKSKRCKVDRDCVTNYECRNETCQPVIQDTSSGSAIPMQP